MQNPQKLVYQYFALSQEAMQVFETKTENSDILVVVVVLCVFFNFQKSSPFGCMLCSCWISAGRQHNILLSLDHRLTKS